MKLSRFAEWVLVQETEHRRPPIFFRPKNAAAMFFFLLRLLVVCGSTSMTSLSLWERNLLLRVQSFSEGTFKNTLESRLMLFETNGCPSLSVPLYTELPISTLRVPLRRCMFESCTRSSSVLETVNFPGTLRNRVLVHIPLRYFVVFFIMILPIRSRFLKVAFNFIHGPENTF